MRSKTPVFFVGTMLILAAIARGAAPQGKPLLAVGHADAGQQIVPSSKLVSATASDDAAAPGLVVTCQPGKEGYPGIDIMPAGNAAWDLSKFGHVEARVVNTGETEIGLTLRVDNSGSDWNAETLYLKPGATGTAKVIFGHSYGHKPAFALKSNSVVAVKLFVNKGPKVQRFRIESVEAGGETGEKPAVDPNSIRIRPKDGVILGPGVTLDATRQIDAHEATAQVVDGGAALHIAFPASGKEQSISIKPQAGKWDLHDALEVRVRLKNDGTIPLSPRVRVESEWNPGEWASAGPLAPGAETDVVASVLSPKVWDGTKGSGNQVILDAVSAITLATEPAAGERSLRVESVRADLPAPAPLPAWLGQRPPVEGDWAKTFDDEFDGDAIDAAKWNVTGENYYDKLSHWSARNVIVGQGMARLRFEKKRGPQNDDPKRAQTDYATGFLSTYDKFAQRYGYFESRMKLPTAPGLWPAFWMMPDRGRAFEPKGQRSDTKYGGMEFDILEHLTRWGPLRYNIAMHWDGYQKEHRSTGTEKIYVQPDKDGFLTAGLLWSPGSLVYYCNGREVLHWDNSRVSSVPGYLMFTMPMGGWDNNPLDDTTLPADLVIDYVRVWQRADLAALPTTAPSEKNPPK